MMPGVVGDNELGDEVLEIGPGPGHTTDWLRARVPHLTAVEVDERLASRLSKRLEGSNVTVVHADATKMSFPDCSFTGAACFTMLHHVPSAALQDRLLVEVCRVLKPRAIFPGTDSKPSFHGNLAHPFGHPGQVDPDLFQA